MIRKYSRRTTARRVNEEKRPAWWPSWRNPRRWPLNIFVVASCAVGAFIFSLPLLDQLGEEWVTCEVTAAKGGISSGGYVGIRNSRNIVRIETTNCGQVGLFAGVTHLNKHEIAESFEAGADYDFKMKWTSLQALQGRMPFSPTAEEYRRTVP